MYILSELYNIYAFMHLSAATPGDWSRDIRRNSTGLTDFCRQFLARDGGIGLCYIAAILKMKDPDRRDWVYLSNRPQVSMGYLRWLDRLKNDDIRQKYDVFRNIIFKALEQLQKAFWNDFAVCASSWV